MDHWGEVRQLIVNRHADRLAERVMALDGQGRTQVAARLPELLKELRGRFERWDNGLTDYAVVLRVAGAATLGGAAAVASWLYRRDFTPRWAGPDNDVDLISAVLADRPAAWRADLAERLSLRLRTADDRGLMLALTLLRQTGIEPPPNDALVAGWASRDTSPPGEDPLLEHLVPRLFEAEGVGRALQWDGDPGSGRLGALLELAEAGRIKRDTLIDGCLRRFLRGGAAVDLRFFVRLHEALDPTPAEAAGHARDYLRLLPASPGPVADLAVKHLRAGATFTGTALAGADPTSAVLAGADLAEAWESLLFRSERKLVRAGLAWLERSVRDAPELADVAAAPLARAFAVDSVELQEKAVELALAYAGGMGEQARAAVRETVELLPPHLGSQVADAFAGGIVATAEPAFVPPPLPAAPERACALEPPPETVGELTGLIAEHTRSWQRWERVLAGFVKLAGRDREGLVAALRSRQLDQVGWEYRHEEWRHTADWLRGAVHALCGTAPEQGVWRRMMPAGNLAAPHLLLLHRAAEVLRAVEDGTLPPLLLATPTHDTGHVAAEELVRRMEVLEAAGAKPLAADLQQALLRLPRTRDAGAAGRAARLTSAAGRMVAAWTPPEVAVTVEWRCGNEGAEHDWHDRGHHHHVDPVPAPVAAPCGLPLVDLLLGQVSRHSENEHLDWWPAMLPAHREAAAAHLVPYVLRRFWHEDPVGVAAALALARAEGPGGEAFAAVLARVLGDPLMPGSVEVLLEVAARGELPAEDVGRHVGLLLAGGEVRMIDMVAALEDAARRGGHAHVWRIAAAALPALLPRQGQRPRNGLAGFVALAGDVAEWCGARGEIAVVRDMAARKGDSGLLRECRRLHTWLTTVPDAHFAVAGAASRTTRARAVADGRVSDQEG